MSCTILAYSSGTPFLPKHHQIRSLGILSNAFSRSTKTMCKSFFFSLHLSCSCCNAKTGSVVDIPGLKPNWYSLMFSRLQWFVPIVSWSDSSTCCCNCCIRGCHLCFLISVWLYSSSSYLGYHLPLYVAVAYVRQQFRLHLCCHNYRCIGKSSGPHALFLPLPSLTVVSLSQCHLPVASVLVLGLWAQALPFNFLHSVGSQMIISISPWFRLHPSE